MRSVTGSSLSYSAELLFQLVKRRPGIHIREAQRRTGLGLGNTVYQLQKLSSLGLIDSNKVGKYKRYYPINIGAYDRSILSALLIPSRRRILLFLLANKRSTLPELASNLRLSKSTIIWHIKILQTSGIIRTKSIEETFEFRLTDPKAVSTVLSRFRPSTIDRLSEGFLKSWELLDLGMD